ncbi:MAG TPA: hypothetical protein VK912_16780 [Longimicrobiales bacterium]|nr:hypothetical protein [Longimicrobiales bacterium]
MRCRHFTPVVLLPFLAAACVSTSTFTPNPANLRMAQDAPAQFVTEDGGPPPEDSCTSPLIDPRDQTRLRLVRSGAVGATQQGDYEVTGGRYGVRPGELLRIDCSTGQALGIVPG